MERCTGVRAVRTHAPRRAGVRPPPSGARRPHWFAEMHGSFGRRLAHNPSTLLKSGGCSTSNSPASALCSAPVAGVQTDNRRGPHGSARRRRGAPVQRGLPRRRRSRSSGPHPNRVRRTGSRSFRRGQAPPASIASSCILGVPDERQEYDRIFQALGFVHRTMRTSSSSLSRRSSRLSSPRWTSVRPRANQAMSDSMPG